MFTNGSVCKNIRSFLEFRFQTVFRLIVVAQSDKYFKKEGKNLDLI